MKLHKELAHRQQFLLSRKRTGKTWLRFLLLLLLSFSNQEWGHVYIYTHTHARAHTHLAFFRGLFRRINPVEIRRTRSFSSPHDERTGLGKLLIGIVNEFPFQISFPSRLKFESYEKEISVSSVGQILFSVDSRRVDLLCERGGSLWKRFWINLIFFECRFRVIEFGSHEKRNFSFLVGWISFLSRYCQVQFNFWKRNVFTFFFSKF